MYYWLWFLRKSFFCKKLKFLKIWINLLNWLADDGDGWLKQSTIFCYRFFFLQWSYIILDGTHKHHRVFQKGYYILLHRVQHIDTDKKRILHPRRTAHNFVNMIFIVWIGWAFLLMCAKLWNIWSTANEILERLGIQTSPFFVRI